MKRTSGFLLLSLVVPLVLSAFAGAQQATVENDFLASLEKGHPRLMLKDKDLMLLKAAMVEDRALQKCWDDVRADAEACLKRPPLVYEKVGPRLLSVSRDCLRRIYSLALAYRWTGDERYAAKARANLLEVCAFPDWNPSHFLDTAEMSHAVGVGYDWLHAYLDPDTRAAIVRALIEKGLEPGLKVYESNGWWTRSDHNWNQVCNGGMIVGALAIADIEPSYAERIVPAAVESLPRALKTYAPDGAWGEGPGYWSYATHYTAYGLAALDTALGSTFGLLDVEGLSKAGDFPVYTTGPTGLYLNLADVGERSARRPMACMFWLARTFHNPLYAYAEHEEIARRPAGAAHLVWYTAKPRASAARRQLDRYFRGPVEVVTMRSAWDDPEALFVGIKAGYNQVNHGHLDLGNFELDALGVRWARDLGADNYNLPGYWESRPGGQRWSYYRLNSASHNICMLGGEDQDALAKSTFTSTKMNETDPSAIVNLTQAYARFAKSASRGVKMVAGRTAVLVQDEFAIEKPCDVVWGMTTDADIRIEDGSVARLKLDGKELIVRLLSPAKAAFTIGSAEQEPPQRTNKGVKRLLARLADAQGDVCIAVLFSPVRTDGQHAGAVEIKPLAQW
ncbi:heparinase II/III domain-containing protein [Anaerobaca lacustris]|uniref:Heparinase II/III family protein n=1 Tax=Anaerobaca lacustris TaxID=3044600 RepID=A0AAW6TUX5_9BACT|nr:heparinase II/III family protein [Sedimentisphaerales bacterium M17dextr]